METQHVQPAYFDIIDYTANRQNQRKRTLALILITIMLATALFGAVNLFFYDSQDPAIVFFVASVLCLPALWLNRRGYYLPAGIGALLIVFSIAYYNLVDGAGLRDPGIVAYPIIIIFSGLLFGKRVVPFFTIIGIGSLIAVVYVQASFAADDDRLVIMSILLLVTAVTTWVIMGNMDQHIAQLKQSESNLRQAYEQTQKQARQVQQIIETVPEGVLLLSTDGQIILANQTAQMLLRVPALSYSDEPPLKRIGDTLLEEILDPTSAKGWQEIRGPDSESIFEVAARPVQHESDRFRDWVLVLRDVTLQRKHQEALQEQERLATVGQLASGIAHDFRNILTVISTYSQILRAKPDTEKRHDYLTVIRDQTQAAAHLIEQILDFSRRSVMEKKDTDLVNLVEGLISFLQRTMPANISLLFEHEPGTYHLNADQARLQQALMNLAVNARDAMPDGGQLKFTLSLTPPTSESSATQAAETETWLCVQVSDTGQGIKPVDLPHIFEPFYTMKEAGRGTGLGLAQVYGIVKHHEGEITVKSTVGQGTTFDLHFPVIAEGSTSQVGYSGEQFTFDEGLTILLVEDNPLIRQSTEEMLKMLGCQVITAVNGQEGLIIFQAQPNDIDLVISDIDMPEMGGVELYHRLQEKFPDFKMLIITGYPLDERAKLLFEQEKVVWMQKPYEIQELARKIGEALQGGNKGKEQ